MKPVRGVGPLGVPTPCNHCRCKIMWLRTDNGKLMPVDAHPDPQKGNVRRDGGHATVLDDTTARSQRASGVPLRVHHRATCPHADAWSNTPRTSRPQPEPTTGSLW